jgi:signal recognition particle subunit SRP54
MLPGMGQMRDALENFDEREVDRIEAIVRSMTPAERRTPKIINGSRRARIAKGSGVTTTDVNQLLERFTAAQKMMAQMSKGGGVPGMPGLPGMGGGKKSRGKSAPPARGKKGKSGNPAKRAEQERLASQRAAGLAPRAAQGSAFGLGGPAAGSGGVPDPGDLELPAGLEKFLGR